MSNQKGSSITWVSRLTHVRAINKRDRAIKKLLSLVEDLGHNGTPPSWSGCCRHCDIVNEVKKDLNICST